MVEIKLPYGSGHLPLDVPDENLVGVFEPRFSKGVIQTEEEIVRSALEQPLGSPRLAELAASARKVVVISSDHTRPLPSRITLPLLLREIRAGNPAADVCILVATGLHRSPTREELIDRYGEDVVERERLIVHDSRAQDRLVHLGMLPSGAPLTINRAAAEADLLIAEGFIEPHFFAGFSGGPKSVLPGIAGEESILANHSAALIGHPAARAGSVADNPIHRDIRAAQRLAGLRFILNVVLDPRHRILAAFAGDVEKAHGAGCRYVAEAATVEIDPVDIVITSNGGYPLDQNLYQAVKGMSGGEAATRPGGTIIIAAECRDGMGGESFYRMTKGASSPAALLASIAATPTSSTLPDQWQVQVLARILAERQVIVVTQGVGRRQLEDMFLTWAPDLPSALDLALARHGPHARIAVIPDGVQVIVKPKKN